MCKLLPKPSRNKRCFADSTASLAFSPRYAAPEVLQAFEAGEKTIHASPALDIWAIGVIAYELLTDTPVFDRYTSREDVISQLVGRKPLPWEDPATKDASLRKLRMLKRSITKCLSREPKERPSAQALLDSWEKLFDTFGGDVTMLPGETGTKSMHA
jgi:serine/threonine protein kinase